MFSFGNQAPCHLESAKKSVHHFVSLFLQVNELAIVPISVTDIYFSSRSPMTWAILGNVCFNESR